METGPSIDGFPIKMGFPVCKLSHFQTVVQLKHIYQFSYRINSINYRELKLRLHKEYRKHPKTNLAAWLPSGMGIA